MRSIKNTVCVFDWDDTIFPTSAKNLVKKLKTTDLDVAVEQALATALAHFDQVVILSAGTAAWITRSRKQCCTKVDALIQKCKIYARPVKVSGDDHKEMIFNDLAQGCNKMVSIGDSWSSILAASKKQYLAARKAFRSIVL